MSDHESECPECGAGITAIVTVGPSEHRLSPCGHRVGTHRTVDIVRAER